jgi:hypothetical protein
LEINNFIMSNREEVTKETIVRRGVKKSVENDE